MSRMFIRGCDRATGFALVPANAAYVPVYFPRITSKVGGQTFTTEMIYAAGSMYMKINGKWTLGGSIKDIEQVEQQNIQHNSKDTCSSIKDDTVNGEIASLYGSHSETAKGNIDLQVWISKAQGLPLREETTSDEGKAVISSRYEYGDVKPPL